MALIAPSSAQLDCKQNLNSSMDFMLKLFCKTDIRFACCKSFISRRFEFPKCSLHLFLAFIFYWYSQCTTFIVFSSSCCSRATGHFLLAEIAPLKLYPRGFAVCQWKLISILIDFPQRRKTREQQKQGGLATFRGCCGPTARACQYLHATH